MYFDNLAALEFRDQQISLLFRSFCVQQIAGDTVLARAQRYKDSCDGKFTLFFLNFYPHKICNKYVQNNFIFKKT